MKRQFLFPLSTCLVAALSAAPAIAQTEAEDYQPQQQQQRQQRRDADDRPRRDDDRFNRESRRDAQPQEREDGSRARRERRREQDQSRQERSSNRSSRRDDTQAQNSRSLQVRPAGWIAVAYDYDNDGFFEGADWIYYYDLEAAKERSRDRAVAEEQARRRERSGDRQQAENRRGRDSVRLRGEVVRLSTKSMMGASRRDDASHQFARLETDSGRTVNVCLGKEEKVAELDLREGDRVTIEGVRARVDDRTVILARRVSVGGDSITNELPRKENWRRLAGKVRSVSHTASGERKERHTVVKVKSPQDRIVQIDLGPTADIEELDLQEGDQIAVLGRQGQIDGESLLIAQLVRIGDETVDVRESTNRSLRSAQQQDRDERRRPLRDRWNR